MRLFMSSIGSGGGLAITATANRFKYGKDFAISSNTDTYGINAEQMEYYAMKYGVRSTVYETSIVGTTDRDAYTQNALESSIYFYTEDVEDDAGIIEIPNYYDATYSQGGVDYYDGVILGDPKPLRYPNNGTQMMFMTSGRVGIKLNREYTDWDKGVGSIGVNNPPKDPVSDVGFDIESTGTEGDGFTKLFNSYKYTSSQGWNTFSYRNGQQGTWQGNQSAIAGRNSEAGGNVSGDYFDEWDISDRSNLSTRSSTRISDSEFTGDTATRVAWIKDKIDTVTSVNGGWFRNFTHWHTAGMPLMESFYTMLGDYSNAWVTGMSEGLNYRWSYDAVSYIKISNSGSNVIAQAILDNKYDLDLSLFQGFLSVTVDLTNSVLAGKNITSSKGKVINLGSDKWMIDVGVDGFTELSEGTPNTYDITKPSVVSSDLVVNDLTIVTDQDTRVTLFSDEAGTVVERKYTEEATHVFSGITTGTYYLGVMNNTNLSISETITV